MVPDRSAGRGERPLPAGADVLGPAAAVSAVPGPDADRHHERGAPDRAGPAGPAAAVAAGDARAAGLRLRRSGPRPSAGGVRGARAGPAPPARGTPRGRRRAAAP